MFTDIGVDRIIGMSGRVLAQLLGLFLAATVSRYYSIEYLAQYMFILTMVSGVGAVVFGGVQNVVISDRNLSSEYINSLGWRMVLACSIVFLCISFIAGGGVLWISVGLYVCGQKFSEYLFLIKSNAGLGFSLMTRICPSVIIAIFVLAVYEGVGFEYLLIGGASLVLYVLYYSGQRYLSLDKGTHLRFIGTGTGKYVAACLVIGLTQLPNVIDVYFLKSGGAFVEIADLRAILTLVQVGGPVMSLLILMRLRDELRKSEISGIVLLLRRSIGLVVLAAGFSILLMVFGGYLVKIVYPSLEVKNELFSLGCVSFFVSQLGSILSLYIYSIGRYYSVSLCYGLALLIGYSLIPMLGISLDSLLWARLLMNIIFIFAMVGVIYRVPKETRTNLN